MISGKFGAFCVAVGILACPSGVRADTATLFAVADTGLSEDAPNLNFGADPAFKIGTLGSFGNFTKNRGLFKFDPSASIPSGATITSVQFTFNVYKAPDSNYYNFDLHKMLVAWSETNASWQVRNAANTPWGAPGGSLGTDLSTTISASKLIGTNEVSNLNTFNSTPGLVADVQGWLDNPASNFGWALLATPENISQSARRIYSRESPNNNPPVLVVGYTTTPPPAPPEITSVRGTNGFFCLSFSPNVGTAYVVERRDQFTNGSWGPFTNLPVAGSTNEVTVCDAFSTSNRFYRVRAQ